MSRLTDGNVIKEFQELDIEVKLGSTVLDKLQVIGGQYNVEAAKLCDEWVAYSAQNGDCELVPENIDKFETSLHIKSKQTPTSRRAVSKIKGRGRGDGTFMYTQENVHELFGNDDEDDELIGMYGTPDDKAKMQRGQKRQQTTPTTPGPPLKSRLTQNGATPTTTRTSNGVHSTPYKSMVENGMLSSTPAAKYDQRQNRGAVVCSLNDTALPRMWRGTGAKISLDHYDEDTALKSPYQFMFQKVSEKALTLLERIEDFGHEICHRNALPEPLSVAQPSLEPAVYTGQVLCEGEGHLNPRSCLLEGPMKSLRSKGRCVKMEIPDFISCSLFPGQVVAVEGINNYNGILIPSKIYDEGIIPPLPRRTTESVTGFMMIVATGPFTTSDNLEMGALKDLMEVVKQEKPDILVLLGPFVDSAHPHVKECKLPGDMTFEEFFSNRILLLLRNSLVREDSLHLCRVINCSSQLKTKLILVPSQRDVHHSWSVYPQPPFQLNISSDSRRQERVFATSDPSTLSVNGLCVGMTSTDILFHLSARTMFRGSTGDRMARVARMVLSQQCYHPLLPTFRREDHSLPVSSSAPSTTTTTSTHSNGNGPATKKPQPPPPTTNGGTAGTECADSARELPLPSKEEMTDVNFDFIHSFDMEFNHAVLPARPDILLLPSDLKPFAKKIEGCICVNPGRLTKKASGGTYVKLFVPDIPTMKDDFSSDIGVQIVYI